MKTRKLLAIMLAIAVLASFISVPVFAEGEGTALETLGILIGPDLDGVTPAYLATIATRAQAALIDLRLEGNEAAALAFDGEETFTDAADATEFWQPILEFLKATPASGWNGYTNGSFKPNQAITGMEFTKILLVSLGYVEGVDFLYADVMDFAETVGLMALAEKADADLTVEDLAVAMMEALGTKINSATDVTLLSQLVIDGIVDAADAVAAGFVVEEEAVVIVDAYASAINEVTVEMSTDVPDDAVVTLKKGTAAYSVDEVVDGDMITLTALFNLPAGTYTVMVDDSSAGFEVMAQYAVDLAIGVDTIYDAGIADLMVQLLDQYGDAMSLTGTNYSVFNQSTGYVFAPVVGTTMTITPALDVSSTSTYKAAAAAGEEVYVFVYDPVSMLTVSGTVVVMEAPYIAGIEIGGVTIGKIGTVVQTTLFELTVGNVLAVSAIDQYGMPYKLTSADVTTGTTYANKVQILSSNSAIIDPSAMLTPNADGNLVFTALTDGQVVITLIIPDQAVIATSELITVYATAELDTITTAGPDEAVYAGEETDFAVAGFDQYGAPFDVAAGVTFTATVDLFDVGPVNDAKNEISFTADTAGTATVYYFLDGIFQGTFDVTVNAAAYPFQIVGVTAPGALEEGVNDTIISADVEVIDQYGRSYTTREVDPFTNGYDFEVMTKAATTLFYVNDMGSGNGFRVTATTGNDTGSAEFVAKLMNGPAVMTESAFTFSYTNVETEDIDGFAITAFADTMYTGATFDFGQAADDYYKTVAVTGTYGDLSVALYYSDADELPDLVDIVTSTNDKVEVMSTNVLVPTAPVDAGSTTVKLWQNGVEVASEVLALDDNAPTIVTVTAAKKDSVVLADLIAPLTATDTEINSMFTFVDQYGVGKGVFVYATIQASRPSPLVPDFYFFTDVFTSADGKITYFNLVKWDGSITATYEATTPVPAP